MKFFILSTALIFLGLQLRAEEKKIEYKNWKTFQSDYGYEFKYPDCWDLKIDDPDEKGEFRQIRDLAIVEGKVCATPRRYNYAENGIGFTAGYKDESYSTIIELNDKKDRLEKWSRAELKNKNQVFFRRTKLGHTEILDYVEVLREQAYRWKREIFCGYRQISISGPSITTTSLSYLEKFKAGDSALPEPEKTIYDSIRCIEPKISNGQKK